MIESKVQKWNIFIVRRKTKPSGAPQSSFLGLLLFNMFTRNIFLLLKYTYFANDYKDDITPFGVRENTMDVKKSYRKFVKNFIKWFSNNQIKLLLRP